MNVSFFCFVLCNLGLGCSLVVALTTGEQPSEVEQLKIVTNRLSEQLKEMNERFESFQRTNVDGRIAGKTKETLFTRKRRQVDPDEVAFTARLSRRLSLAEFQTVVYDDIVFQSGSAYDNSTGIFTCPTSGLYLFGMFVEAAQGLVDVCLKKDGRIFAYAVSEEGTQYQDETGGNLVLLYVARGSRIWIETTEQKQQDSLGHQFWPYQTTFSGVLIHRHLD